MRGEVVGVNTAIYSQSGGSVRIAFAIPAPTVPLVSRFDQTTQRASLDCMCAREAQSTTPQPCIGTPFLCGGVGFGLPF
jgi:hypothetical protein